MLMLPHSFREALLTEENKVVGGAGAAYSPGVEHVAQSSAAAFILKGECIVNILTAARS
jgi:hypothetical protein